MNTHYTYFLILAASLAGPLLLSFDKKVAYYTRWKFLFRSVLFPALLFIVWDMYFTDAGVWQFNEQYITGIKIYNLPIEEVLFFFIVPYACVFIYECIICYFPQLQSNAITNAIMIFSGIALICSGIIQYDKMYTLFTFMGCGILLFIVGSFYTLKQYFNSAAFIVSYAIILIPFLVVNGFLTAIPVVIYNNSENLGIRIYTIPFEDIFYGMLLMLLVIAGFEKKKRIYHQHQ